MYPGQGVRLGHGIHQRGQIKNALFSLSLTGVRERLISAIPISLKLAVTCGIGLFIAFIGLKNAGVVELTLRRPFGSFRPRRL